MKQEEFKRIYDLELVHWWYRGLDNLVIKFVKRYIRGNNPKLLDAGCGTGRIIQKLCFETDAFGIDYASHALKFCRDRGLNNVAQGELENLPFMNNQFEVIVSLDVLYHEFVGNDQLALDEFYRTLKPGGKLILNLPALKLITSRHDKQVGTRERYTKKILLHRIRKAGFRPIVLTYRLFPLFLPIAAIRLLQRLTLRSSADVKSDLTAVSSWFNQFLYCIIWLENCLIGLWAMPIGSSLFLVAEKE